MQQKLLTKRVGAGSCDVRGERTQEQESKQGTDTPSLWKVIAAYYLYLELSVLRSSLRVAQEDDKRNNHNSTKKNKD